MDVNADKSEVTEGAPVPVGKGERLISLDLIRGIAVLGILLANVTAFGQVDLAYYWPLAMPDGGNEADRLVWLGQYVLVDGKFRGLFTILFGASMVLFVERVSSPSRAMALQMRRLAWLLLFGMAHFFLLFQGDILFAYACGGFFALFALRMPAEKLLAVGIIWAVMGGIAGSLAYLNPMLVEAGSQVSAANSEAIVVYREFWAEQLADATREGQLFAEGSYWDIVSYRVLNEAGALGNYFTYAFFETIPLMLVGMGFYRSGVFAGNDGALEGRGLAWTALLAGIAMNVAIGLYVYVQGFPPYLTQMAFFGISGVTNVPLLLGGTWLLAHWAAKPRDGWLAERLSMAGRMAFTNYIGTSLLMVLMFQGWAGGLFGTLHRLDMLLVVALGWAAMVTFSRMWLGKYRYGPLEYCWRCLTYWQIFPLRR